jgi:hypothetical protein
MVDPTVNPCARSSEPKSLRYSQYDWGDCIYGSKAQLQALGIGVGVTFPGEPGGAKRKMSTTDQRGFPVEVCAEREGGFCASVRFPAWPSNPSFKSDKTEVYPGVLKHEEPWNDLYTGSAENLVAAGLVMPGQFPGLPGMRKLCVSIYADGRVVDLPTTSPSMEWRAEGAKRVYRAGKKFQVAVHISDAEYSRREAKRQIEEFEWPRLVRSLQRPARLDQLSAPVRVEAPRQRGHLRLVWSAV